MWGYHLLFWIFDDRKANDIDNEIKLDENECDLNTNNCDKNAMCNNTIGSFNCTCNSGYSGNGVDCNGTIIFVFWKKQVINKKI